MSLISPGLDYTDRDFDAIRARLHNLIDSAFPTWTDKEKADFGNILIDLNAFVLDVLTYYQDNQAGETRITTARLRRSMLALVKLIGYKPTGAVAATAELRFLLASPPVADVEILAGDRFRTLRIANPVSFQALAPATIATGADPPSVVVTVENSEDSSEVFQSSGLPNQEILLNDTPFLDGSLAVAASDGAYELVEDFLDSGATDRHFTIEVDENDRARVRFGNGVLGAIPQATITCAYKTGGGSIGNVDPGTIVRPERAYTDIDGGPVTVSVTNVQRASGGLDRQTVESIRVRGPRSLRATTRSVAREDFEIHALKVPGVARALMLTSNERPGIEENHGQLVIVPGGGGLPTQELKDAVLAQVTDRDKFPKTLTFLVEVIDPVYKPISVQAKVFPSFGQAGTQAQRVTLDAAIRAALVGFFALEQADGSDNATAEFGLNTDGLVAFSDLYNVVRDVSSVRRIGDAPSDFLLNGQPDDIVVQPYEFPTLGTVTLLNGFTGLPLAT
jgi:uncharacterized phage protein gp47/JayE